MAAWTRPVPGAIVRPFAAPRSRYGAGHRGVDFAAAPGTAVVAPGAGRVVFAGQVGGSLHVVVDHGHGVRTSLSFLATISVRPGAIVVRGRPVGTAGGIGPEHEVGVLHVGVRVGEEYVDPMRLFVAVDLAAVVRLAPVRDEPSATGYSTPAGEARGLAESLHIPRGIPGLEPEPEPSLWDRATDFVGGVWAGATTAGAYLLAPGIAVWHVIRDRTPVGATVEDLRSMSSRLLASWRSRSECTADTAARPGGGGSGHLLFAVGGINSATRPRTGVTFGLDTAALGYRDGEVGWYSYSGRGGAYTASDTWGDLVVQGYQLRDQLRAFARASPGREVDLVAHSQGGVVVDVFTNLVYDPADPTLPPLGNVVTLSSPHRGAPLATLAQEIRSTPEGRRFLETAEQLAGGALPPSGGTATRQLAEGSRLLDRIWSGSRPDQLDVTAIGATDDVTVPAANATHPDAETVTVDPAGFDDHSTIVDDRAAMAAARLALEGGAPPCVGLLKGVRGAIEPVVIRRVEITLGHVAGRAIAAPRADAHSSHSHPRHGGLMNQYREPVIPRRPRAVSRRDGVRRLLDRGVRIPGLRVRPTHARSFRVRPGTLLVVGCGALAAVLVACGVRTGPDPVAAVPPIHRMAAAPAEVVARWSVDHLADPTQLLVSGRDTFVVFPYSVMALSTEDGRVRWEADVKDAEPYVAADGSTVLVGAVDGFEALDRSTGVSRWRSTIDDPFDRGRTVGLVTTADGVVAIGTTDAGGVVGLDARTGAVRWSLSIDGRPRGRIVGDDASGAVALVTGTPAGAALRVFDAATGGLRWSVALNEGTGTPLIDGSRLVIGTGEPGGAGVVRAYDLGSGAPRWETSQRWAFQAAQELTVSGSQILAVDAGSTVRALDRATGSVRWERRLDRLVFRGRAEVVRDQVVILDGLARLWILDRRTGSVLRRLQPWGVPVAVGTDGARLVAAASQVASAQVMGLSGRLAPSRSDTAIAARIRAPGGE